MRKIYPFGRRLRSDLVQMHRKALWYTNQKIYEKAIKTNLQLLELFNTHLDVDLEEIKVLCKLCALYREISQYKKAINVCKQALKLKPTLWLPISHLAITYRMMRDYENAIPLYIKSLQAAPTFSMIWQDVHQLKQEKQEAEFLYLLTKVLPEGLKQKLSNKIS